MPKPSKFWLFLPLLLGFITPSLVILALEVFVGRRGFGDAVSDVLTKQFAEGHSLFLLAAYSLIPFVLLSLILILPYRSERHRPRVPWLSLGGTIGALALMIPMHVGVSLPLYTGGRVSSTSAIAYVFIPFLCIVSMLVGLLVAVLATRGRVAAAASPLLQR
jgi:hypothetical protein